MILSIDQNSHPLWDAAPKVHALAARGLAVCHLVEDVDVAFTCLGCRPGDPLRIVRERYHHSGGADWGAALFYSDFLGRLPVDVREFEPPLGLKLAALARQLDRSVESLYDEFSPGDNYQLVGPSYAGDENHHRVIGDLGVSEAAPFLRDLLARGRSDTLARFPQPPCQTRANQWFDAQQEVLDRLIADHAQGKLVDLYRDWMGRTVGLAQIGLASSLGDLASPPAGHELLELFLRDYDQSAALYNEAVAQAASYLRPLRTDEGELPFFALLDHGGSLCRTSVHLRAGQLRVGEQEVPLPPDRRLPLEAMRRSGIRCLAGKAVLLVIQVRLGESGRPLALPHHGSVYVPAAHALTRKLAAAKLLDPPAHPILRVRLRMLDRLGETGCVIRLPDHLAAAMGAPEVAARDLAGSYEALAARAEARLQAMRDPAGRLAWQREALPDLLANLADIDTRRRELAKVDPKSAQLRELSHHSRQMQTQTLQLTLRQVAQDWQVRQVGYWDSRGAIIPWAIAAGGEAFYRRVLESAEIVEERE